MSSGSATSITQAPQPTQSTAGSSATSAATSAATNNTVASDDFDTTGTTVADEAVDAVDHPCLHIGNRAYEICTAYTFNASGRRAAYYKFARSANPSQTAFWTHELETRYYDQARTLIEAQVASWPAGTMKVDLPRISIKSVTTEPDLSSSVIQTVESWKVQTQDGQVLFEETDKAHIINMSRVPGIILHKWVVTDIK